MNIALCLRSLSAVVLACQQLAGGTVSVSSQARAYDVGLSFADGPATHEWGVITNHVGLSIWMEGDVKTIKTNEPVNVIWSLTNASTNEPFGFIVASMPYLNKDFPFEVIAPSGKNLYPTNTERLIVGDGSSGGLPPGGVSVFTYCLSQLCSFNEVGTYKIVAKRRITKPGGQPFWVVSNPLYLSVVSGEVKTGATNAPSVKSPIP
ncbi:MAG TPA: hypothetical protein VN765_00085 [Candidatus Acidoferrum sp.]|nr:hypothetical protein [Candidatus Acidoferrum sp.]